ncbi:hypothetical protein BRADO4374 [Bradyrhizobium sp. ORS 278]|uniref:DUF6519 domain-containing protein n=1 Tax=Bradyrhizobium sp. (strain ORS 278) TaxID=114615 RepID=UPI0001508150|nr:DUF6519 domain-containing protein [Bradyrhizobium sp. ORS 278]CAL78118.1 hypothetical protein BRADO4374 [Bradyrhizobium sp. ORS 278]
MKGDFSRDTFDSTKHYSSVLMQQGRVQLDADWNEQQSIHHHRIATEARDVIGFSGAPLHAAGFKITVAADNRSLVIGQGRYYVDGRLCENESDVGYAAQPDLINPPDIVAAMTAAQATAAIIYLDVWSRSITALDDPMIRETALGGPDTAARIKTVWQVKALVAKPDGGGGFSCGDPLKAWDDLTTPSSGALSARAQPAASTDGPCLLPPGAGFRRLENQLYRVEIHSGGALGASTFKWSRDNGAIVTAIDRINGQEITVRDLGRDDVLGFASGQWVEVSDESRELSGAAGQLAQIDTIDVANRIVTLKQAVAGIDATRKPRLRRWDGGSTTGLQVVVPATNDGWIPLEDGVEVKFAAGNYASGDYWLIPARTLTGDVEWPFTTPRLPRGKHSYARLAVVTLVNSALTVQDCRNIFTPLAEQPPAIHVRGVNWLNDDIVAPETIFNGLNVMFDTAVTPLSTDSSLAVASLTMDMPMVFGTNPLGAMNVGPGDAPATAGLVTLCLNGELSLAARDMLQWKPAKNGAELRALIATLVQQRISRVGLRFRLRGGAIWQEGGTELRYLDGQAFGQKGTRSDSTPRIDLRFPSGSGRRVSDFESWFFLQLSLPPSTLVNFTLDAQTVIAGGTVTGTVTLDFLPTGPGANIALSSSAPNVVTFVNLPNNSVNVPPGRLQSSFQIKTNVVTATTEVLISATLGAATRQVRLSVQVVGVVISPPSLSTFTGRSQQFSATVTGGVSDASVSWSITEPNGGSINSTGLYVAPAAAGTYHVVATSAADRSKSAAATVQVTIKPKEKEKDKDKDKEKEGKEKERFEDTPKIRREVLLEQPRPLVVDPVRDQLIDAEGRSFILVNQRPVIKP